MPSNPAPIPTIKQGEHWNSYSPNTDEGLPFEKAYQRLTSANQAAFRKMSEDMLKAAGLKDVETYDAIGDWSDGAENSLFHIIHNSPNPEFTKYIAAWHGLLGNQKSVLHFEAGKGPDSLYQIFVPSTSANSVRKDLDHFGIKYRTIVPRPNGTVVLIYDEKRSLRPNVQAFGDSIDATIREATGRGEFIGDTSGEPTRTTARHNYRELINTYESSKRPESLRTSTAGTQNLPSPAPSQPRSLYQQAAKGAVRKFNQDAPRLPTPQAVTQGTTVGGGNAPPGGAVIRGMNYNGGQFTPKMNAAPIPLQPPGQIAQFGGATPTVGETWPPSIQPQSALPGQNAAPLSPSVQPSAIRPPNAEEVLRPQRTPKHEKTFKEVSDHLAEHLDRHLRKGVISKDQMKSYTEAAHHVWSKMPHKALNIIKGSVKRYFFFPSTDVLTTRLAELTGDPDIKNGGVGGAYGWVRGEMFLDGPYEEPEKIKRGGEFMGKGVLPKEELHKHLYAHEFGHALDWNHQYTRSQNWRQAWSSELRHDKFTKMASFKPEEGWAEFARELYMGDNPAQMEKDFPRCADFFKRAGLWPSTTTSLSLPSPSKMAAGT